MKLKTIEILVRNDQDPRKVALEHDHCPTCKKALTNQWQCLKCKIQLIFVNEYE